MSEELLRENLFHKGVEAFRKFLYAQTGEVVLSNLRFVWQAECLPAYKWVIACPKVPDYIAELTYNGDKGELYVFCYCKMWSDVITKKEESK